MAEKMHPLPTLDLSALPGPETILREELDNGVMILIRENFASPSVVVAGYLTAGALADEPERWGQAYLTALALMRGTESRSFQEIFEALESVGARLGFQANAHSTSFQGKSLSEDLSLLVELLEEVLSSPTFPSQEVERLKAQHLTSLAIRAQDTGAQAQLAFDELVYRDHPYRIPIDGYVDSVGRITPAALRKFHRREYGPRGMVVAIVGGVERERALEVASRALSKWAAPGGGPMREVPPAPRLKEPVRREVRLPGKQQSDLVIGAAGPSRFAPDFMAAALGNSILGRFGLMGRIGDAVRERAGLAYYAYSAVSGGPGPGPWQVLAGVAPDKESAAAELILQEIRRFTQRKVSFKELRENQSNFIGRLPLQLESNEGVASALTYIERYGLELDHYQRYPVMIEAITREQILETARRYLDPERLAIAIAGPER